jgi:DNA-binding PadR family transcriptional regulator
MSSIRLFILSSFEEIGPMHGHRLRLEAEQKMVSLWTDISVGAVYGAMSRLANEGLLKEAGQEQEGNRPVRQLYEITDAGRKALETLRREGLEDVWFKNDPFDLALTKARPADAPQFVETLKRRLETLRSMLQRKRDMIASDHYAFGPAEKWALRHTEMRLATEVAYLEALIDAAAELV